MLWDFTTQSASRPLAELSDIEHALIARTFILAGIPVAKEPAGLSRLDDKIPDGLTFIP